MEKTKAFFELYNLINYYYEHRDQPTDDFDFFNNVEKFCKTLDLDFSEFKKEFNLQQDYL